MAMTFQQQLEEALKRQQPAFRPSYEGLLSQPTSKVTTPETFQPGLLNQPSVGRQLGLLGLSFAPGAGISDYAGTFPSAQGGFEPSFQQNVQQGNYFTAGLQGLGAFGDMATAATAAMGPLALAGMGVGSIAKAPRAVQRGVEGLIDTVRPKIDDLGFFSQVEKSVMDIPQQRGTGQQFLAQIQKTPGVKPEELQYTGLDQFLANKPTVTKAEIQDYLDANRVQVQEVTLGGSLSEIGVDQNSPYAIPEVLDVFQREGNAGEGFRTSLVNDYDAYQALQDQFPDLLEQDEWGDIVAESLFPNRQNVKPTKFNQYTIPGGENYREVLLTLPKNNKNPLYDLQKSLEEANNAYDADRSYENYQRVLRAREELDKVGADWSSPDYRSSHFDQPNILAHMRVNDRTIDGKPTLFIEEVQSDWHQAGRKKGYATGETKRLSGTVEQQSPNEFQVTWEDGTFSGGYGSREAAEEVAARGKSNAKVGVPDAPFKSTWDELTLKRAIKMASDEGYDQIAFTTGKTQAERYDLSKQIDRIEYAPAPGNNYAIEVFDKEGKSIIYEDDIGIDRVEELAGKEIAQKISEKQGDPAKTKGYRVLSDLDLQVGGEGMKGFYDKMLPKKLEKIGKKYGAKPTKSTMQTPDGEVEVWTFNIPKEMRETVKEQGQPLFQIGVGAAGLGAGGLLATEEEQY